MADSENLSYAVWGSEIEPDAHAQMRAACGLPVSVRAALMADAHVGYGLPIGGVLATRGAVIPYAVGVDIACRVRLTVFDLDPRELREREEHYKGIIARNTAFGVGAAFEGKSRAQHPVMDEDWSVSHVTAGLRDKAWSQLGTSGSGNHFVEFGSFEAADGAAGVPAGRKLALVSHSGSRGAGAAVCAHYSRVAAELHPDLAGERGRLAWLPLDPGERGSDAGLEYWNAMELMGRYASANHQVIHERIARSVGAPVLLQVENHHNFAWKERHETAPGVAEELIVHRKGATPAGKGVLGYIPGTMVAPGFLVEGLGQSASLDSASHGAGRAMSRTRARKVERWETLRARLDEQNVRLISAGLDESPIAYKDIHAVMRAQADLVRTLATFQPMLVKMAPDGERPED
ncbi:MAG: RtcB family protein [Planctomycetota bacterium]|nr:RtcB family protein [Planctomycetota bacterium]